MLLMLLYSVLLMMALRLGHKTVRSVGVFRFSRELVAQQRSMLCREDCPLSCPMRKVLNAMQGTHRELVVEVGVNALCAVAASAGVVWMAFAIASRLT